jgi:ribonuclease R
MSENIYVNGITIDSSISKDLDDAIWLTKEKNGFWFVQVSIANVTSFVRQGTDIDLKAQGKAFSRYFGTYTIPMLPRQLAERDISLLPNTERKTITFNLRLNQSLEVVDININKTILKNSIRLSHKQVSEILNNSNDDMYDNLSLYFHFAELLLKKRILTGALAIYDDKNKFITTEDGLIEEPRNKGFYKAYIIVQEFMILINQHITEYLYNSGVNLLFRNHEVQDGTDIKEVFRNHLLSVLKDPDLISHFTQINKNIGHLLARARYESVLKGHFGLNLKAYAHWTSPIRRYADLVNHRILISWLENKKSPYSLEELSEIAYHLNSTFDEMQDNRSEQYKNIAIKRVEKSNVEDLDSKQFTLLMKHLYKNRIVFVKEREENIIYRIENNLLSTIDLTYIIFINNLDNNWDNIKKAVMEWLEEHIIEVLHICELVDKVCNWGKVRYKTKLNQESCSPVFDSIVTIVSNDDIFFTSLGSATTKKNAEKEASLNLFYKIANVERVKKDIIIQEDILISENNRNFKGEVIELCQKNEWSLPEVVLLENEGQSHNLEWSIQLQWNILLEVFKSDVCKGSSKKSSEQLAYANLIEKIKDSKGLSFLDFQVNKKIKSLENDDWINNPVSSLNMFTQKIAIEPVIFTYKSINDNFQATCVLSVTGRDDIIVIGQAMKNKKESKKNASIEMCKIIFQDNFLSEIEKMS